MKTQLTKEQYVEHLKSLDLSEEDIKIAISNVERSGVWSVPNSTGITLTWICNCCFYKFPRIESECAPLCKYCDELMVYGRTKAERMNKMRDCKHQKGGVKL